MPSGRTSLSWMIPYLPAKEYLCGLFLAVSMIACTTCLAFFFGDGGMSSKCVALMLMTCGPSCRSHGIPRVPGDTHGQGSSRNRANVEPRWRYRLVARHDG